MNQTKHAFSYNVRIFEHGICSKSPGNFFGFRMGTNLAPSANAMGAPKMKPRASIPTHSFFSEQGKQKHCCSKCFGKCNQQKNAGLGEVD